MGKFLGLFSIIAIAGCGGSGKSLGAPVAATTSQQTAATTAASTIDTALALKANPSAAQSLASSGMNMIASSITPSGAQHALTSALALAPADSSDCVVTSATGYTYNNCTYGGYTVNGSANYTETSSTFDLAVTGNYGGYNFELTESGSFNWTATHFGGTMTVSYKVSGLPAEAGSAINFGGTITWDVNYSGTPACISSGFVEVDGSGLYDGAARYEWTACGTYLVRNT